MSTNTRNKMQEGLIFAIGVLVIAIVWIGLVYGLLGYLEPGGQRWAATITTAILLPVSILVTRKLTINEIRAHERGINLGVGAVSKARARRGRYPNAHDDDRQASAARIERERAGAPMG